LFRPTYLCIFVATEKGIPFGTRQQEAGISLISHVRDQNPVATISTLSEADLESVPCNVCGAVETTFVEYLRGRLSGYPFPLVRCRNCGLLYLNPRPRPGVLHRLYTEQYFRGEGKEDGFDYTAEHGNPNDALNRGHDLRAIMHLHPPPGRVLDVGCGVGGTMRGLLAAGYDCRGVEVSEFAAAFARQHGYDVSCGDFLELDSEPDAFDVVVAIEVLEHVADPRAFIEKVYTVLKPGGLFYYTTGNFRWFALQRRLFGRAVMDLYLTPEEHIYFLSTRDMRTYFRNAGFSTIFTPRLPFNKDSAVLLRMLRRAHLIRNAHAAEMSTPVRWLYNTLILISEPFYRPPLPLARK
jgi:2-polyprenyl-3-methyl-5-hydroxy-6-metoxy-1,4-benzoquinol methylase